jgi:rhamnogalacturonan hydrolase
MKLSAFSCLAALLLPSIVTEQLSGSVGPTTTRTAKRTKVCNVLSYGGVASLTSDIGPPLASAFAACASGGTGKSKCCEQIETSCNTHSVCPPGNYGMSTWVTLSGGTTWALQLDGIIYRVGTAGGNMIFIEHTTDFEMYSSTSKGALQGYGYVFHAGKILQECSSDKLIIIL